MVLQLIAITVVKITTSKKTKRESYFNFMVHILENINIPFPYKDWDTDNLTVAEFQQRLKEVNKEMAWTYFVNFTFNILMFFPFWWTGVNLLNLSSLQQYLFFSAHKIFERHQLLKETISTRQDENDSYEMVTYLNNCLTPIFLMFLCLEIVLFYTYTNLVTTINLKSE